MAASRKKKVALGCAVVVLLAAALFFVTFRRFIFAQHVDVVSIRTDSAFQDHDLLERAWRLPVAALYKRGEIAYQPNGSTCGPTSLANVSRSLGTRGVTPELILQGTGKCPGTFCFGGLTLDELGAMARSRLHRRVTVLRNLPRSAFHDHLRHVNDVDRRYVVNFDRGPLFGTRSGHFSPIVGFLADRDLALVLDVNAKFHPWLVRSERLYEAMRTVDPSTDQERGMLLIQ